jgi:uncharacterized protein YgiM (DUF1202 family)
MLRRGPGTTHLVLGLVFDGATYEILGRDSAGDWWLIAVDAQTTGWVSGSLLTIAGDLSTVVVVSQ